jgi:large subunit ribosomal protein L17e
VPTVVYVDIILHDKVYVTNSSQINPYMSNPCHIELILAEGEEAVQKAPETAVRLNNRQRARRTHQAAITAA